MMNDFSIVIQSKPRNIVTLIWFIISLNYLCNADRKSGLLLSVRTQVFLLVAEFRPVVGPKDLSKICLRFGQKICPGLWARTVCSFSSAQAATLLEFMYHSRIVLSVDGSVWYMIRNLRFTVTIDSNCKT